MLVTILRSHIKTIKVMLSETPVIAVGIINITTGKTAHDWNIYEDSRLTAYLTSQGFLLLGAPGSFEEGDNYDLISDQTRRRLSKVGTILSTMPCSDRNQFIAWLKSHNFDYSPIRAFSSRKPNNRKLTTSYVLK